MTSATASTEVIARLPLDADPHAAVSHLQDVKTYAVAVLRYWVDLAEWTEHVAAGRMVVPVIATCATIIGAAVIGVNL